MGPVAAHLERALSRIDQLEAARDELVAAWQRAPQERLARLVELADVRLARALPEQLVRLGDGAAANAPAVLAAIPSDPRVAPVLLELLARPPWRGQRALPFWRAACERIVATRDPRILARLEDVALGYPQAIPTTIGKKVAGYLGAAVAKLRDEVARVDGLGDRAAQLCAELEARLGATPAPKRTTGTEVANALYDAVYEAPHDDAPRLVLADHLAQRGDPRGDFINMQLARAAGRADDTTRARELELHAASQGRWAGPIGVACEPAAHVFRRGFVAYARIPRTKGTLARFAGEPAWHAIERLDVTWSNIVKDDRAALIRIVDTARALRAVTGLPARFLAKLEPHARARLERLERVEVGSAPDHVVVADWLARARAPRSLGLALRPRRDGAHWRTEPRIDDFAPIFEPAGFARLEQLVLYTNHVRPWLSALAATALPRVVFVARGGVHVELDRIGDGFGRATFRHIVIEPTRLAPEIWQIVDALRDHGITDLALEVGVPHFPGRPSRSGVVVPDDRWQLPSRVRVVDDLDLLGR